MDYSEASSSSTPAPDSSDELSVKMINENDPNQEQNEEENEILRVKILDELEDCLKNTGISQLQEETFWQFLHDIGHEHICLFLYRQTAHEMYEKTIEEMLEEEFISTADEDETEGDKIPVSFYELADIQLRLYLAHHHHAEPIDFKLKEGLLSYTPEETCEWIKSQGSDFTPLVEQKWNISGLISASPKRIAESCGEDFPIEKAEAFVNTFREFIKTQQLYTWFNDYFIYATREKSNWVDPDETN